MENELYICGKSILYEKISDCKVGYRLYAFRPVFKEQIEDSFSGRLFKIKEYVFVKNEPYTKAYSESEYKEFMRKSASGIKSSVGTSIGTFAKETGKAALSTVGTVVGGAIEGMFLAPFDGAVGLNAAIGVLGATYSPKNTGLNGKFYYFDLAGKMCQLQLDTIPVKVEYSAGYTRVINANDDLYSRLQGIRKPFVSNVPVLNITAHEEYYFFGNGIDLTDVFGTYSQVKQKIDAYQAERMPDIRQDSENTPIKKPSEAVSKIGGFIKRKIKGE